MPTVDVRDHAGGVVGQMELAGAVFDVPFSSKLVHQVVTGQLANRRQGNAKTKTRAEVRGGGIKPFRQKGTGRARQGSIRAPHFRGGGRAWGPSPRSYRVHLPKSMRRAAVRQILSDKVRNAALIVIEDLNIDTPKTQVIVNLMKALNTQRGVLLVVEPESPTVVKSAANVGFVRVERAERISALDALRAHVIVATRAAARRLEEMYRP